MLFDIGKNSQCQQGIMQDDAGQYAAIGVFLVRGEAFDFADRMAQYRKRRLGEYRQPGVNIG